MALMRSVRRSNRVNLANFVLIGAVVPTALLMASLSAVSLQARRRLAIWLAGAIVGPLLLLSIYLAINYSRGTWWPFRYNSEYPHAIAALASALLIYAALARTTGRLGAKLLVGTLSIATWLGLWFGTAFIVACNLGHDCI